MELYSVKDIKTLLNEHDFKFSKSLGQNFIIEPWVCPKMAESCSDDQNDGIIEIGPGIGVLTVELAKRFKKVVSVELDSRLIPILKQTTADFDNVKIINDDILKVNLKEILQTEFKDCKHVHICANLPYYITSEIIMYILESNLDIGSLTVMVQKEAAERICAEPGSRESGAISLAVRFYGVPKILFDVSRGCFMPQPNVDSSVIKIDIDPNISSDVKNKKMFFKVVKAAFGKRRKNLLNSLSMGLGLPKNHIAEVLSKCSLSPSLRAEQLSLEDFKKISNSF